MSNKKIFLLSVLIIVMVYVIPLVCHMGYMKWKNLTHYHIDEPIILRVYDRNDEVYKYYISFDANTNEIKKINTHGRGKQRESFLSDELQKKGFSMQNGVLYKKNKVIFRCNSDHCDYITTNNNRYILFRDREIIHGSYIIKGTILFAAPFIRIFDIETMKFKKIDFTDRDFKVSFFGEITSD